MEQVSTLGLVRTLFAPCSDLVKFAGHLQPKADSSTPPNLCFYIPMQHAFTMGLAPEPTKTQIQRRRPHGFFTIGFPFMKCNQTYSIAYMFMTPMKPAFTMGFAQEDDVNSIPKHMFLTMVHFSFSWGFTIFRISHFTLLSKNRLVGVTFVTCWFAEFHGGEQSPIQTWCNFRGFQYFFLGIGVAWAPVMSGIAWPSNVVHGRSMFQGWVDSFSVATAFLMLNQLGLNNS